MSRAAVIALLTALAVADLGQAALTDGLAAARAVHVEIITRNIFRAIGCNGIQNRFLHGREFLSPFVILRLGTLINSFCAFSDFDIIFCIVGITFDNFHASGNTRIRFA